MWEWSQHDHLTVAEFVNPETKNLVSLDANVGDEIVRCNGDYTPIAKLIYNKLLKKGINYARPKGTTATGNQQIRRPDEILDGQREGTCLDLALLFCGLCLGNNLLPIFVLLEGHAFVVICKSHTAEKWKDQSRPKLASFNSGALTDPEPLRNLVTRGDCFAVECTGFAHSEMIDPDLPEGQERKGGRMTFEAAVRAGEKQLLGSRKFLFALDIAWAQQHCLKKPRMATESFEEIKQLLQQMSASQPLPKSVAVIEPVCDAGSMAFPEHHQLVDFGFDYVKQGNPVEALTYFEKLLNTLWPTARDSIKYRLLANLGMVHLALDDTEAAADFFVRALEHNPNDPQALALAATGHYIANRRDDAERELRKSLAIDPLNSRALALSVEILAAEHSIEEALASIPPDGSSSIDVAMAAAKAAMDKGDTEEAAVRLRNVLETCEEGVNANIAKLTLGAALLGGVLKNLPAPVPALVPPADIKRLEEAVRLYSEVIGDSLPHAKDRNKLWALANRGGCLRFLGRNTEAIRDYDDAIRLAPEVAEFRKQRALLAFASGEYSEAIDHLERILGSPETPEAVLLLAVAALESNDCETATKVLEDALVGDTLDTDLARETKRMLVHVYLKSTNYSAAQKLADALISENMEPLNLLCAAQTRLQAGDNLGAAEFADKAMEALGTDSALRDRAVVADFMFSTKRYNEAAKIYEEFVDKTCNFESVHRLRQSYFLVGNFQTALDMCREHLARHGPTVEVSDMAAHILESAGELEEAREICQKCLAASADDVIRLRLALIDYWMDNFGGVDAYLDSPPRLENLSLESCELVVDLCKRRERSKDFFELLYKTRDIHRTNSQAHLMYFIKYNGVKQRWMNGEEPTEIVPGVGFYYTDKTGNKQLFLLVEGSQVDLSRCELGSTSEIGLLFLGKTVGDEVTLQEDGYGKETVTISHIIDKYSFAYFKSLELLAAAPKIKGFRTLEIAQSENPQEFLDSLQPLIQESVEEQKRHRLLREFYEKGEITFGFFAEAIDSDPIKLWTQFANYPDQKFRVWMGEDTEFKDALIALEEGGLVVADLPSLLTLNRLGLLDVVRGGLGQIAVIRATLTMLTARIERLKDNTLEGISYFSSIEGQPLITKISPEEVNLEVQMLESLLTWIKAECRVLPHTRTLSLESDERIKREKVLSKESSEVILVTSDPNRILYCDDEIVRRFASLESIRGVWTQTILYYCLKRGFLNSEDYHKSLTGLAILGHRFLRIEAQTLLIAAEESIWLPNAPYMAVLEVVRDPLVDAESVSIIAAEFVRQLFNISVSQLRRDSLIMPLLTAVTERRSSKAAILQSLRKHLRHTLHLIPTRLKEVLGIIRVWSEINPVRY